MEKKGQIWVETVIYTVIGLTIIAIVLSIATPAINKYKDKTVIEQTIVILNNLNEKILEVRDRSFGNRRTVPELRIKKGSLTIDPVEDKIFYTFEESVVEYTEPGEIIEYGDINIITEKKGRKYDITLTLLYEDINLSYDWGYETRKLDAAPIAYKLSVENNGTVDDRIHVNIKESS